MLQKGSIINTYKFLIFCRLIEKTIAGMRSKVSCLYCLLNIEYLVPQQTIKEDYNN